MACEAAVVNVARIRRAGTVRVTHADEWRAAAVATESVAFGHSTLTCVLQIKACFVETLLSTSTLF